MQYFAISNMLNSSVDTELGHVYVCFVSVERVRILHLCLLQIWMLSQLVGEKELHELRCELLIYSSSKRSSLLSSANDCW